MHAGQTSSRVALEPFAPSDAAQLVAVFRHPAIRRYLLDDAIVSEEWVADEIAASQRRFARGGAGLWALRLTGRRRIVGFVGFREFFEPPQLQLLYGLLPEYWGQGLATEAARQVCQHAFDALGFTEVRAATDRPNAASIQVLQRLGMREVRTTTDGAHGTVFFEITRAAWRAHTARAE